MLTPGRYVGAADVEDDDRPFAERFAALQAKLNDQFDNSAKLTVAIRESSQELVSMSEWAQVPFELLLREPVRNGIYKPKEFHGRGVKIVNMGELLRIQDYAR